MPGVRRKSEGWYHHIQIKFTLNRNNFFLNDYYIQNSVAVFRPAANTHILHFISFHVSLCHLWKYIFKRLPTNPTPFPFPGSS